MTEYFYIFSDVLNAYKCFFGLLHLRHNCLKTVPKCNIRKHYYPLYVTKAFSKLPGISFYQLLSITASPSISFDFSSVKLSFTDASRLNHLGVIVGTTCGGFILLSVLFCIAYIIHDWIVWRPQRRIEPFTIVHFQSQKLWIFTICRVNQEYQYNIENSFLEVTWEQRQSDVK